MAQALKLAAQRRVVVDLAIEHHHEAPVARFHGLVALRREIQDGEAPKPEAETAGGIHPESTVIGAPMADGLGHVHQDPGQPLPGTIRLAFDEPRKAAHLGPPLSDHILKPPSQSGGRDLQAIPLFHRGPPLCPHLPGQPRV